MTPSEYPLDWYTNYAYIILKIEFAPTTSPDEYNAEAKLLKKKLFEPSCLYLNVGSLGWNSIWTVSFAFPIGT